MAKATAPQPIEEKVRTKTVMNKGHRAFHVKPEAIIKGGELAIDKSYGCINQGCTVEIEETVANQLLKNYPHEIIDVNKGK